MMKIPIRGIAANNAPASLPDGKPPAVNPNNFGTI